MAKSGDSGLDLSKANELRRYISDYEYKLGWDVPRYSDHWYRMLITDQLETLTQEHINLYVVSVKLSIALYEGEWDNTLKYYPKVSTRDLDRTIEKVVHHNISLSEVIPTFEQMESASTDSKRLEAYLSLSTVDDEIIYNVYRYAKNTVDKNFEETKKIIDQMDRYNQYKSLIQEMNEWKFHLKYSIDQQPLNEPVKNVESYIEKFEVLYYTVFKDVIEDINTTLELEERSSRFSEQLRVTKDRLLKEKDLLPADPESDALLLFRRALGDINEYKQAPSIQPLKEVINDAITQYDEWLEMALTDYERNEVKHAKHTASFILIKYDIYNEEELQSFMQDVKSEVERISNILHT